MYFYQVTVILGRIRNLETINLTFFVFHTIQSRIILQNSFLITIIFESNQSHTSHVNCAIHQEKLNITARK